MKNMMWFVVMFIATTTVAESPTSETQSVDWALGEITLTVFVAADSMAKSAVVARSQARQVGTRGCRNRIVAYAKTLPWVSGKPIQPLQEKWLSERVTVVAEEFWSDGSVSLRCMLPVESVRRGGDVSAKNVAYSESTEGRTSLLVTTDKKMKPMIGMGVRAGNQYSSGPTIFVPKKELSNPRLLQTLGKSPLKVSMEAYNQEKGEIVLEKQHESFIASMAKRGIPTVVVLP